jgi:hypothetical protein
MKILKARVSPRMFKEAFTPVTTLGKIYVRAEKFVRL